MAKLVNAKMSVEVGDRFFVQKGDISSEVLPKPVSSFYWDLEERTDHGDYYRFCNKDEPRVVGTTENLEQIIKDREETIKELTAQKRNLELESSRRGRALDKAIQEKKTITEAFDKRGQAFDELRENYDDLRKAMKEQDSLIASRKEEHDAVYRENLQLKDRIKEGQEQNTRLQEQADKFRNMYHETKQELKETLEYANRVSQETNKPKASLAPTPPKFSEFEQVNLDRMKAEVESLKLDNDDKAYRNKFKNDYPEFVWRKHDHLIDEVQSSQSKTWFAIVAVGIALTVNEVIQWVNL